MGRFAFRSDLLRYVPMRSDLFICAHARTNQTILFHSVPGREPCADLLSPVHGAKAPRVKRAPRGTLSPGAVHLRGGEGASSRLFRAPLADTRDV